MRIYKEEEKKSIDFFKYYKYTFSLKNFFLFSFLILISIVLFAPLGLSRSDKISIRKGAKYFTKFVKIFDKQSSLLTSEIFLTADNLFGIGTRYLKSFSSQQDELKINLSFKNYQKISNLRNKAIKDGMLTRSSSDKVKGYISYKGKNYPVRLRLKGDWTDHLLGEKWSFRIETKNDSPIYGMREFSLQHPRTRSYLNESIMHKLLKYEKLPYLRYKFLPVSLNGKYLGIYALEEHFGKELIENSGFREGPIIKISDQDKRGEFKRMYKITNAEGNYLNVSENNSDILTFNFDKISKNKNKISQYQLGASLFNEFLRGNLKTSDVFDVSMTARYFALTDLLQATSANTWYDMRFYFDPISARLIPIGYDAGTPLFLEKRMLNLDINTLNLFDDPLFTKEYLATLNRISKNDYLENFLEKIASEINAELAIINKSFPFITFSPNELKKNNEYIKNRLNPLNPISFKSMKISKDNEIISLKVFNKTKLPIEIRSLVFENSKYKVKPNTFLNGKKAFQRPRYKNIDFFREKEKLVTSRYYEKESDINTQKNDSFFPINFSYKIGGSKLETNVDLKILKDLENVSLSDPLIKKTETLKNFKVLKSNNNLKEIYLNSDITIKKPLILEKDYKLIISPGVKINLEDEGLILVKGPLIMKGEKLNKIQINSSNGGKGILVLNSSEPSLISNSIFKGLRANTTSSTNITGGLSFYNSSVEIHNSEFRESPSEDALNLVRSPFLITNSYFLDVFSDAIDVDFSNGKIQNSTFKNIGNDAIDISGAEVSINDINIKSSGDKAISVGESSKLYAKNINISNSFIGIASKDFSYAEIENLEIQNVPYCLAAYQKKPEYGPASIITKDSNLNCQGNLLEKGSTIKESGYNLIPNSSSGYKQLYSLD